MKNPRLQPVRITDKNGKGTTVYRRPATSPGSNSAPPPPAPAPAAQSEETTFYVPAWAAVWIAEDSPQAAFPVQEGSVQITEGELFAYLRLGVGIEWGAAMHATHPDPAHWERTTAAKHLANERSGTSATPSVTAAVDLMREQGYSPSDVERMIDNGFSDGRLHGVLTPQQTATLFTEIHLRPANPMEADAVEALATCLTDGTMPLSLAEDGRWPRTVLMELADFAVKCRTADGQGMRGPGFHTAAAKDPGLWDTMAELISTGPRRIPAARAWKALRVFGAADCLRFGAQRLITSTDTGRPAGEVVRQARALGMSDDAIEDAFRVHGYRGSAVLAIARGEAAPAVANGWL